MRSCVPRSRRPSPPSRQAYGARNFRALGAILQRGLLVNLAFGAAIALAWLRWVPLGERCRLGMERRQDAEGWHEALRAVLRATHSLRLPRRRMPVSPF